MEVIFPALRRHRRRPIGHHGVVHVLLRHMPAAGVHVAGVGPRQPCAEPDEPADECQCPHPSSYTVWSVARVAQLTLLLIAPVQRTSTSVPDTANVASHPD